MKSFVACKTKKIHFHSHSRVFPFFINNQLKTKQTNNILRRKEEIKFINNFEPNWDNFFNHVKQISIISHIGLISFANYEINAAQILAIFVAWTKNFNERPLVSETTLKGTEKIPRLGHEWQRCTYVNHPFLYARR